MLVFWLGAVASKVAFLIIVETCDLTNVRLFLLFLYIIGDVDDGGRSLLLPLPSIFPPLISKPLLFILSSFLDDSAALSHDRADFGSLSLVFLGRDESLEP